MTDIDTSADIDISVHDGQLTVRLPLAGPITHEWQRRYHTLARANDVPAKIMEKPGQAWIVVTLPGGAEREDVVALMDAARGLTAEAEAADQAVAETEATVRDWWARQS
jgi:HSP20 family molecular chaperone IbpA